MLKSVRLSAQSAQAQPFLQAHCESLGHIKQPYSDAWKCARVQKLHPLK